MNAFKKGKSGRRKWTAALLLLTFMAGAAVVREVVADYLRSDGAFPNSDVGPSAAEFALVSKGYHLISSPHFDLLLPLPLQQGPKVPLVIALSPSGNAEESLKAWYQAAEKRGWAVLASKTFHNDGDGLAMIEAIRKDKEEVLHDYPRLDATKVIVSGFSGGGMGAHLYALQDHSIRSVVINTGMMDEYEYEPATQSRIPHGKLAVFLASPSDFRYKEMKKDEAYLKTLGWRTKWIEFSGGHAIAPPEAYESAAKWLETN